MQGLRCRILSSLCGRIISTSHGVCSKTSSSILLTCGSSCGSEFNVASPVIHRWNENTINGLQFLRSMATQPWPKTANSAGSAERPCIKDCVKSLFGRNSQEKILAWKSSKPSVKIFVMDIGTSGCFGIERITEIAFRDLSGGENSCFHTMVDPEHTVTNSEIHGITTEMVNQENFPRIEQLIPIIIQFVQTRQTTEGPVLFLAHNGFRFDFRILLREFNLCSIQIPNHWRFLDTLPLGRDLVHAGLKPMPGASLSKLCEHYNIEQEGLHRAMPDVNLLTQVFLRMVNDLELSKDQLLKMSLDAFQLHDSSSKLFQKSTKK